MKVPTQERGDLEVLTISEHDGVWEGDWANLQKTPIAPLLSPVSKEVLEHALVGYSRPLVDALGISPEGALRKIPSQYCSKQSNCTFYDQRKCLVSSSKLPWCYEPEGVPEEAASIASEAVFHWKNRVYLLVVSK